MVMPAENAVRLVLADPDDETTIGEAIRLGDMAKSTLGQLVFAAYYEAAADGNLVVAYSGDRAVGYALYALAKGRVRLTHLCVDPEFRRRGVGHQLVDYISARHSDYLGIAVSCRHDYKLGPMWIKLGFTNIGERRGRGRDAAPLVDWWRDHGHPNLFTVDVESVLVRAALDLNVLRDVTETNRPNARDSQSLVAPHMATRLELVRTAALDLEIDRMTGGLRGQCARRAQPFKRVHGDTAAVAHVAQELTKRAQLVDPNYPADDNDRLDLSHVAHAVGAGLKVFVTKDLRLASILGPPAVNHGLRVLSPTDVVVHIDELERAEAYRPVELLNTAYVQRLIPSGHDDDFLSLTNTRAGEGPKQFKGLLKHLALEGHGRIGIYDPSGIAVAAYSDIRTDAVQRVPVLRVVDGPLGDTLARQLIFLLRQRARNGGMPVLRITDVHMSSQVRTAALADGFQVVDSDLYAYVLPVVGGAASVEHQAVIAARRAELREPGPLRSGMPVIVAAELEHAWWPAKIVDSNLATYVIPIQQRYSAELLGVPSGLWRREEGLGLNREHVYYRSPGGTRIEAPARLLWYMSAGGPTVADSPGIIACSELDSVVIDVPANLYSRFRHLGIWREREIASAAREGRAQALRFTNTELFNRPISRNRFRRLAGEHGLPGTPPPGPLKIPPGLFASLYQEGSAS
jgi:ribosomal protein S18 acetylase RimI-like enzyme